MHTFAARPDVELKYVCDVDENFLGERTDQVKTATAQRPTMIKDLREALDDAVVLGTPTHWHALQTILACQAGKDVYIEKEDAHNIVEGQTMVAAAKRHGRIVQLGTQSRSERHFRELVEYVREGHIGRSLLPTA